jgi:hypothetical protein
MKFILSLLLCLFITDLKAETININKLDFKVDRISTVDDVTLKVDLFGKSAIIEKIKLEEYVVKNYFHTININNFSSSDLLNFIKVAIQNKQSELAEIALVGIIENLNDRSNLTNYFSEIENTNDFESLLKKIVLSANGWSKDEKLAGWILCKLLALDYNWVKTNIVSYVFSQISAVKSACADRYQVLLNTELSAPQVFIENLEELLGSEDSLIKELKTNYWIINTEISNIKDGNYNTIYKLIQLVNTDEKYKENTIKLIVNFFHKQANKLIQANYQESALILLSWIESNWRTDETHKLVLESLRSKKELHKVIFTNQRVRNFLNFLAEKDKRISRAYIDYLQTYYDQTLLNKDYNNSKIALSILKELSSENNNYNTAKLVIKLHLSKQIEEAQRYYKTINGWVGLLNFIKLLALGYIIDLFLLIAFIVVTTALLTMRFIKPRNVNYSARRELGSSEDTYNNQQVKRIFELNQGNHSLWVEYERLLSIFSLNKSCSMSDIKKAYRHTVKTVHPDANLEKDVEDKFLQLSKSYERLLELRKILNIK